MKRKYFDVRKADFGSGQGPQVGSSHWSLLEAYVRASCHTLGFDITSELISIILRRDVMAYLTRGSYWLNHNSMYDSSTPLQWVRTCRQAWSLLKKYPFGKSECDIDRVAAATEKLYAAERQCKVTNDRLRRTPQGELPPFIWYARRLIADVLGECNSSVIMDIITQRSVHGKGSTRSNHLGRVTSFYKYADFPYTVTKRAANYALASISANVQWMNVLRNSGRQSAVHWDVWPFGRMSRAQSEQLLFSDCVDYAEDDDINFAPKTALTDRPMAIGASLNLFLQLGVNDFMTEKLKPFGVNLLDQSRNQRFAFLGSRYWSRDGVSSPDQFSTIDLASASDTIAYQLVKLLLPSDWFSFLCDLRHVSGVLGDSRIIYEKFSAMGNGFTFPLESLIFWAVSKAAQEVNAIPVRMDDISVYGDDIIVRRRGADHVISALEYCGFTVNTEKSFVEGPFKESCGCDYFNGADVRPIQLAREIKYDTDVYYIANRISRLVLARGPDSGLTAAYSTCVRLIPRDRRRYGSMSNSSDECLVVPLSSLNQQGLRPYLTDDERKHLIRELRIDTRQVTFPAGAESLPVELHLQTSAVQFSGRGYTRRLVWFSSHRDVKLQGDLTSIGKMKRYLAEGWQSKEDFLHREAAAAGQVTRRGCLTRSWVVRPVPSWDGVYSRRSLTQHPVLFMDRAL